jgi:hypothetical protein
MEGALSAYAIEKELQSRGLADEQPLTRITLLTALATYEETVQAVKNAINNARQSTGQQ